MNTRLMRSCLIVVTLASLTCIASLHATAQGDTPKEILRFKNLPGMWNGTLEGNKNGKPVKGTVRHLYRICSGGWGLEMNETLNIDSMPGYICLNVLGFNSSEKKVHLFSVANSGDPRDQSGTWKDEKTLAFEYNGTLGGKPYKQMMEMIFDSDTSYHITDKTFVDGKETFSGTTTMTKNPAPKRLDTISPPGKEKRDSAKVNQMRKDIPKK